ncbi:hypothetical protein BKA70DRAFT_1372313 [Coprinopsis sp. MPI-PUGE-AT-0042]|nr:hypothetical protein BKA70DRAFT_1372313 [Coprinopsis sp. MPI-PUGE-AT-0042]
MEWYGAGSWETASLPESTAKTSGPQVTDIDEKLLQLRRRTAGPARIRDRTERERPQASQTPVAHPPHSSTHSATAPHRGERSPRVSTPSTSKPSPTSPRRHAAPQVVISRHSADVDAEDLSRRLHISSRASPRPAASQASKTGMHKLYNPDADRIHIRRAAEPEAASDTTGSSYVPTPRPHREERGAGGARQLFDFRKDDPVRFSSLGDYVSASSTSSNNASQTSSVFTLSSTTDGSSASSHIFDGRPKEDDSGNNIFGKQSKRLYRTITEPEARVQQEDGNDEDEGMTGRGVVLKGKEAANADTDKEKWKKLICDHKELAETVHNLLEISLSPSVPASLRTIPDKYNIIVRLWTYAFHKVLESLRRVSFQSPVALEHLQDFIYYAYTFYTGLLEEPTLNVFKSSWLEALGDLAWYCMAVAAMVNSGMGGQGGLTTQAVTEASAASSSSSAADDDNESVSDSLAARINDSPSPSVRIVAARSMELEPEKERWRNIAREWYGAGLAEQPGTGKLHHHLGLLSREVVAEELRGIYHFTKSMTTLHPFSTSRENILPVWSSAAQARRSLPDARASELFVLLHGMLFTNIQLDDFQPSLTRFIERLNIEGAEEKEWIMMGTVNIAAMLKYGCPSCLLRKLGVVGPKDANVAQAAAMRVMAKKAAAGVPGAVVPQEDRMEWPVPSSDTPELPPALGLALQLTFTLLSHVLHLPHRQISAFAHPSLNPRLATILKQALAVEVLERSVSWQDLQATFDTISCHVMSTQALFDTLKPSSGERWPMLTSRAPPALPKDWCTRGMEWYWKSGEGCKAELHVLKQSKGLELAGGRSEDDNDNDADGLLTWFEGTREWKFEGNLAQKVGQGRGEDKLRELEEENTAWASVDDQEVFEESDDNDENDSGEIQALKSRCCYLGLLLKSAKNNAAAAAVSSTRSCSWPKKVVDNCPQPSTVPSYSILIVNTNILLSSLSLSLHEHRKVRVILMQHTIVRAQLWILKYWLLVFSSRYTSSALSSANDCAPSPS